MPIEGFSKYHICKNGRLYYVGKIRKKQYEEDFKRTHGMES